MCRAHQQIEVKIFFRIRLIGSEVASSSTLVRRNQRITRRRKREKKREKTSMATTSSYSVYTYISLITLDEREEREKAQTVGKKSEMKLQ